MRSALAAGLVLLAVPAATAADATYRLRGDHLPSSVVRNGYHQVVTPLAADEVLVQVATEPRPVGAVGMVPADAGRGPVPEGFRLPRALARQVAQGRTAWAVANAVLVWVDGHLQVRPDDEAPQDAAAVLARGGGRCSGLANATAALLMAAGLPARTVSGLLVGDAGAVPHRWVECELPGAGWVPTDPTLGLWVLTPRHVVFDRPVLAPPRVEIVDRGDDGLVGLPTWRGRPMRPNHGASLTYQPPSGEVRVRIQLRGPAGAVRWGDGGGRLHFGDLLPGRWELHVECGGAAFRMLVHLEEGEHVSVALPAHVAP